MSDKTLPQTEQTEDSDGQGENWVGRTESTKSPRALLQTKDELVDLLEEAEERGRREMARSIVRSLMADLDGGEERCAALTLELDGARAVLRRLCDDHGDNDWPDSLNLADALANHLGHYLEG